MTNDERRMTNEIRNSNTEIRTAPAATSAKRGECDSAARGDPNAEIQ